MILAVDTGSWTPASIVITVAVVVVILAFALWALGEPVDDDAPATPSRFPEWRDEPVFDEATFDFRERA